jgi:hypothetical protein
MRVERGQHALMEAATKFASSGLSTYSARTMSNTSPNNFRDL